MHFAEPFQGTRNARTRCHTYEMHHPRGACLSVGVAARLAEAEREEALQRAEPFVTSVDFGCVYGERDRR